MKLAKILCAAALSCASIQLFAQITPKFDNALFYNEPSLSINAVTFSDIYSYTDPYDYSANSISGHEQTLITYNNSAGYFSLFTENEDNQWDFLTEVNLSEIEAFSDYTNLVISRAQVLSDQTVLLYVYDNYSAFRANLIVTISQEGELSYQTVNEGNPQELSSQSRSFVDGNSIIYLDYDDLHITFFEDDAELTNTTFSLDSFYDVADLYVDPVNKTFVVTGKAYEWSNVKTLMEVYSYEINDGVFDATLLSEVTLDEGLYSDSIRIIPSLVAAEFATYQIASSAFNVYRFNDDNASYEVTQTIDIETLNSWPYYFNSNVNRVFLTQDSIAWNRYENNYLAPKNTNVITSDDITTHSNGLYNSNAFLIGDNAVMFNRDFNTSSASFDEVSWEITPLNSRENIQLTNFERTYILENSPSILAVTSRSLSAYNISENGLEKSEELELDFYVSHSQQFGETVLLIDNSGVSLVSAGSNDAGEASLIQEHHSFLDSDKQNTSVYLDDFDYDADSGLLVVSDYSGVSLFKKTELGFELVTRIVDGASNVDNILGIVDVAIDGNSIYVLASQDATLSKFTLVDGELVLDSHLTDSSYFSSAKEVNTLDYIAGLSVVTNEFILTFTELDGAIALKSVSPSQSNLKFIDDFHAVSNNWTSNGYVNSLIRLNNETGFWQSSSAIELESERLYTIVFNSTDVLQVSNTDSNVPTTITLKSLERAPMSKQPSQMVAINQGENAIIDLESLFFDLDSNDTMSFEIIEDPVEFGLTLNGGILETVDAEVYGYGQLTVKAIDSSAKVAETTLDLAINRRPQLAQSLPLIDIQTNENVSIDLSDYFYDDQDQTISLSFTSDLPEGVTFDGSVLSGAPVQSGDSTLTLVATDNLGAFNSNTMTFNVSAPPPPPAPPVEPNTNNGSSGGSLSVFYLSLFSLLVLIRRRYS